MENNSNNFDMDVSGIKFWRNVIKIAVYLVYFAGGLFATVIFSESVSNHFPESPLMRAMAFAGAWANFFSLVIMPLAKEYWINGKSMTLVAWFAWVFEVLILVMNVLSAYGSDWASWWTGLAPASPVYVIMVWGLMWYLNPEAKVHQAQVNFYTQSQMEWQKKLLKAMQSEEIQDIMNKGASQAATQYTEKSLNVNLDKTHGRNRQKNSQPSTTVQPIINGNTTNAQVESNGNFTKPQ